MKPSRVFPLLLSALLAGVAQPEVLERVIVKVNGDLLTLSEFEARQVAAVQQARIESAQIPAYLRENNARILQEAIDDLLLVQRASDLEMKIPREYLKEVIENIKKENNIKSDQELQEQLRREGMSVEDLQRNIERSILRRQVLGRELEAKVVLTEDELRSEYAAHVEDYTQPPRVHLQEIVVRSHEADAESRARALVQRARSGEDFAALARDHSEASTRTSGGELGQVTAGDLAPAVGTVVFALKPGEVSDPLPTSDGFRIFRLVDKTEGAVVPFEQRRDEIRKRMTEERMTRAYDSYMEGLRKTAVIDVRVREVPLQVSVPTNATPLLEAPSDVSPPPAPPTAQPAAPVRGEEEITTSPQSRPEHIVPTTPTSSPQP